MARFLQASASNGARSDCVNVKCDNGFLPGEGQNGNAQSTSRGFFEFGLRLVYLIPTGASAATTPAGPAPSGPPAPKPAAPATAGLAGVLF